MKNPVRAQVLPALTLLVFLVAVGVVLQLWLLGASLDGLLGGRASLAFPAAIASLAICLLNVGLLSYVQRIDRHVRLEISSRGRAVDMSFRK